MAKAHRIDKMAEETGSRGEEDGLSGQRRRDVGAMLIVDNDHF
jgi:hypothetical protein